MRRQLLLGAIAVALAAGLAPPVQGDPPGPSARTEIERQLSGIDFLPDAGTLSDLLSGNTAGLVAVATTDDMAVSPGIRIRAFRSLGLFNDPIAHTALTNAIAAYRDSDVPLDQLYLIAALEALGDIAAEHELAIIAASFGHDRRDIRAAAARALGETGRVSACALLIGQHDHETDLQVRLAIGDALDRLGPICR